MSFITKYGSMWGLTPRRQGRVHFVAPANSYTVDGRTYSASDNNNGLAPEVALRTIAQAITNATANAGDVIYLLAGTHTVTAMIAVNKAGLAIVGPQPASLTAGKPPRFVLPAAVVSGRGTNVHLWNITVSDTEIGWLGFRWAPGFDAMTFQTTNALENLYIHDCYFDMSPVTASTYTRGINFQHRAVTVSQRTAQVAATLSVATAYVGNCTFDATGAQGPGVLTATCSVEVVGCRFNNVSGTWATPFMVATGTINTLVQECIFTTAGTMGAITPASDALTLGADAIAFY